MEFVFVVGIARTGSKIYLTTINRHTDIDLVNEMHYLAPWYIRRDAVRALRINSEPLTSSHRIERALDLMYSGNVKGTFWENKQRTTYLQQRLTDIDRTTLARRIAETDGSARSLFRVLLEQHAETAGKSRGGAKFPVDISRVPMLMKWFPNAKFIQLIRDPRAIYSSMVAKDNTQHNTSRIKCRLSSIMRANYLVIQFKRSARVYSHFKSNPNYKLYRLEDMINARERSLRSLCHFLETPFYPEMLNFQKYDSSYESDNGPAKESKITEEWKHRLTPLEKNLFDKILKKEMSVFGYI